MIYQAIITLIVLILGMALANAQSQQEASPTEQVLSQKLMAEMNAGIACNIRIVTLQKEVETLQARVKALEPKPTTGGSAIPAPKTN